MRILEPFINFAKRHFVLNVLFLLLLGSSYALLHPSFFHVHDFTHAARIAEMSTALREGQLPVRWSANFGYGFGMPLFNFYAPLPYFVGALFDLLGVEVVNSLKLLYFLSSLLALVGAYLFGRLWLGRLASLTLAGVYLLAPYRAVNLFVRGALSEAWAMAFLPWVLWAAWRWVDGRQRRHLLYLTLALAAIILSHNLTALMFIPLSGLLIFLYLLWKKQLRLIWPLLGSYVLAFALTAFYSLPSFMEKDYTQIHKIFAGYFHYSHHFLYIRQFFQENWQYGGSAWGPADDMSFFLGATGLVGLGVLAIILLRRWRKWHQLSTAVQFWLLASSTVLGGSLFLTLLKSQWLWDHVFLLPYIQFPWRFLSLAALFLAILTAISVQLLRAKSKRYLYFAVLMAALLYQTKYFQPSSYLDDPTALYYTDASRIRQQMSETLPDYIPAQMADGEMLRAFSDQPLARSSADQIILQDVMVDRAHEKLILLDMKTDSVVDLKIAAFPGWQLEIDGEPAPAQINEELGNLQIVMPAGEHKLSVVFTQQTPARLLGNGLSGSALILLLYFFWPFAKSSQRPQLRAGKSKR